VSPRRTLQLLARDLGRGPRSPTFLYALLMPLVIAFVTKVIMLVLIDPEPRLGIVDLGGSQVTVAAQQLEGIELTFMDDPDELKHAVESWDLDAGLILPAGFDAAVKAGERPDFDFRMAGESRVTQRIVLAVTSLELIREIEGRAAPVEVTTTVLSEGSSLPIGDLVVLGILFWPLLVCSTLVPGMMLVQEKEQRTLMALLVTPATLPEILVAKAALGFGMAMTLCVATLLVCGVTPPQPVAFGLALAIAVLIHCEIGLLYGTTARDGKTLYNMAQTMNMVLLAPMIFYFFPSWPQWPAKLFPTWYVIDPLYRIGLQGAGLGEVWVDLAVALGVAAALAVPVVLTSRRMKRKLVGG
jgi:ABC-2 type transport system permease protein